MMNKNILAIIVFICFLCIGLQVKGQSTSYSPYSIFGIGDIENADYGRNLGMGGVGIGLKSFSSLNRVNPASYDGIDSLSFTLEASMSGRFSKFDNGVTTQNNTLAGFKKLALGFQVFPFWHTSAGVMPFSNMGYDISLYKQGIEGDPYNDYTINLTGAGSVNRYYLANSFRLIPEFSVGINVSLLFGTLTQDEKVLSDITSYTNTVETTTYLHRVYVDYGFQYSNSLKNGWKYIIGGIGGLKSNLHLSHNAVFSSTSGDISVVDDNYKSHFNLPLFGGVGFSLTNNTGFTVAFDYVFQKWSGQNSKSSIVRYVNSNRFAAGVEYTPAVRIPKSYFQRMFYQAGFNYNQSYLQLRGKQINQLGVSVGAGFPIKYEKTYFAISLEKGTRGRIGNDLFRENYTQVNFSIVFRDIWFLKSKFD
jgi:hypothetical protein